jgi:putative ABC transport system permease protein
MLRNYLIVAWRTLQRNPTYTALNTGGLALGLACCVLIALYVQDELSYDDFHEKADRLVLVASETEDGREMSSPYPLADALEREGPSVKQAVRTWGASSSKPEQVSHDGETFAEERHIFHAGEQFFELFSFPLVEGAAALGEPNTAVVSKRLATKYFPEESPVGQRLWVAGRDAPYRITGVARSRENSHFDFNALLSFSTLGHAGSDRDSWDRSYVQTWALLQKDASTEALERQATALRKKHHEDETTPPTHFAQPVAGLYLSDLAPETADFDPEEQGFHGNWRYLYLFGAVAFFILLLACVNYVNLATARSARRAKEVGVRRTVGAGRFQVARQFLGESVLLTLGALALSLVVARAALPVFNHLVGKELSFPGAGADFVLLLFGAALAIGLLAGAYPAVYLSGFRPAEVLRGGGGGTERGRSGAWLRKGLVAFQFAVAVALMAATGVVYWQLHYTQTKDLGFEEEQVVTVSLQDAEAQYAAVRRAFAQHSSVVSTSASSGVPSSYLAQINFYSDSTVAKRRIVQTDSSYLRTLGIELTVGRFFSDPRAGSDTSAAYVINETLAREMDLRDPVGQEIINGRIVGVVEDHHFESFREEIGPLILSEEPISGIGNEQTPYSRVAVRFQPGQAGAVLGHLEATWAQFSEEPLDYTFLDQAFAEMYRTERRLGQVFTAFALVAVLIACLGLYGLAAFAAERRSKEIAIRKTFGASTRQIVALLSKQFLMLVGVGFVLGTPVAWYGMSRWLEDFAYRIDLSPWLFAAAGLVALVVAMGATCWQALRAARTNPAQALKDE